MRTEYLNKLKQKLSALGMPIYFESQDESTIEPFIEIGISTGNNGPTAKVNRNIRDDTQHIDIYLSRTVGRAEVERIHDEAVALIGRSRGIQSNIGRDDSIGRDVYHISIRVSNLIF